MRARRSSAEIGFASAVRDFSSAAAGVAEPLRAAIATKEAPAAPRRKMRLDNMVVLFLSTIRTRAMGANFRRTSLAQGYFNSAQSSLRDVNMRGQQLRKRQ